MNLKMEDSIYKNRDNIINESKNINYMNGI